MSTPSRSSTLNSDLAESFISPPTDSRLYNDAAEFGRLLAHSGCIESPISTNEDDSFAKFVGRELTLQEPDNSLLPENLPTVSGDVKWHPGEKIFTSPLSTLRPTETQEGEPWRLNPDTIVRLLIEESGPLTVGEENETLVMDVDGCLFAGVMILGALHLTTHRLAFHASLCEHRRGLASPRQVLKSGTAILHQNKWRPRRRVWLELATDMLCVYRSSNHDETSYPLRSILFALVDTVAPVDSAPTYLQLILGEASERVSVTFEFDTSLSAQDWRRELCGALFLSRHQRRNSSDNMVPQDSVRFSLPLKRIDLTTSSPFLDALTLVSLQLSFTDSDLTAESTGISGAQVLQVAVLKSVPLPSELAHRIAAEKHRTDIGLLSLIVLDLGPFSFAEQEARRTTCSDLGPRQNPISSESHSRLWFCPARLTSATQHSGHLAVTPTHVGFWSKDLTRCNPKHYLLFSSIRSVEPFRTSLRHTSGMALVLKDHERKRSMRIVFGCSELRDEAMYRVKSFITPVQSTLSEKSTSQVKNQPSSSHPDMTALVAPLSRSLATAIRANLPLDIKLHLPKAINIPSDIIGRRPSLHFICLTIGSRGDVQPYIALGLGLKKKGHRVTVVTHEEYKDWVESFGIQHRVVGGDPGRLMKLSVENKTFSPEFFKKTVQDFRSWLDDLLADAWEACRDAEVLLESPSAMAGVHIAEALGIPYMRTFTMPWTKTSEFPHPFFSPPGGSPFFNSASYILFNNVLWRAASDQINTWRKTMLGLGETDMGHAAQSKLAYIYDFSQAVVPKPLDWGDNITISGYWFLENAEIDWEPPSDFLRWMEQARKDGKPIVYIGFGSITVPRPNRLLAQIVRAATRSDVRAIISKGWANRMNNVDDLQEVTIPPSCFVLDKVPHDWLFPRIDAAMHHGGAGTTGASLRAGIPTLIKPWFGDQFFWASRVEKLGAGIRVHTFRVNEISDALVRATTDSAMKEKAAQVGRKIRAEDGVHTAIYTIYMHLDRLKSRGN